MFTISETWLTSGTEDLILKIDGYDLYRADRALVGPAGTGKRGGGLITYLRTPCNVDTNKYHHLVQCNSNVESQVLVVNRVQDKGVVIINIYRPPKGNLAYFLDYITQLVEDVGNERYRDICVLGDFNLDHSG